MARSVGSRMLRTRLGFYLRMVREGKSFVVTDRGNPVATLGPLPPAGEDVDARLAEMESRGEVRRGSHGRLPRFRRCRVVGRAVSETLVEAREDRV